LDLLFLFQAYCISATSGDERGVNIGVLNEIGFVSSLLETNGYSHHYLLLPILLL